MGIEESEPVRALLNDINIQSQESYSLTHHFAGAYRLSTAEVLWARTQYPYDDGNFWQVAGVVSFWWLLLTSVLAALGGILVGSITARSMRRRLNQVASTADRWKTGDFASMCATWPDDDIGELGRRLNAMAVDLRDHVLSEQRVAKLEERSRLMRDLHDTVKQRAFAAAMQLGAARTVLGESSGPAQVFVAEAEKLTNRVQEDLMSIIHEMRPDDADVASRSLGEILRRIAVEWSAASHIPVDVVLDQEIDTSTETRRTISRIASEALANVRRHSEATQARLILRRDSADGSVHLLIIDNGRGFDTANVRHGMGLYSMRDRALSLPVGQYSVESKPGTGTTISATWSDAEGRA